VAEIGGFSRVSERFDDVDWYGFRIIKLGVAHKTFGDIDF